MVVVVMVMRPAGYYYKARCKRDSYECKQANLSYGFHICFAI